MSVFREMISLFLGNMNGFEIIGTSGWSNTGWGVGPEQNYHFEVTAQLRGSAAMHIGDWHWNTAPGEVCFVDNSVGSFCERGDFSSVYVELAVPDRGSGFYRELKRLFGLLSRPRAARRPDVIERMFMEMVKEFALREPGYDMRLKCQFVQVLVELLRSERTPGPIPEYSYRKYSDMISEMMLYLSKNTDHRIPLQELGEKYGLNPVYLNRVFKAVTGHSITECARLAKVDKAKRLLASEKLTLLDIALELGYGNSQYLNRVFKSTTGMTPGEYRHLLRKQANG